MMIRSVMSRRFGTPLHDLPALSTVQNFGNYHARAHLENNDRVDDVREWVHAHAYTGEEGMTQPFTFGWDLDCEGKPIVGNGSDERPFIVGLSSKALAMRMMLPPGRFILHVDATYKQNYCECPVLVVGVSDRSHGFHLVALFIISQETQHILIHASMSLMGLYFWICGKEPEVLFTMRDADKAQHNALQAVFGVFDGFKTLMCFFHAMKNVYKAIRGFHSGVAASIVHDMYDLHFARSENSYLMMRGRVVSKWYKSPGLASFAYYMWSQWLPGPFSVWQLCITGGGFASTNNPAETFNALFKRDYILRCRLKMGALLKELLNCCEDQSVNQRPFRIDIVPATTLVRRVSELVRGKLLGTNESAIIDTPSTGRMQAYSLLAKRIVAAPNKRSEIGIAVSAQIGANYARMEVKGQSSGGWIVDTYHRSCGCNYIYAFGVCVHLLFAVQSCDHLDSQGREVLGEA
ncbi:unnamed protein product [Phytophthora fragariaefolia]|uniref:Unnamed protein product n=1 Tax=Phytophthora fragariaefolia TaxID=1490495 RepID=A0A9W6XF04_9STRA|nr:unnamed protein product [Phytophthora fragariaefolia]